MPTRAATCRWREGSARSRASQACQLSDEISDRSLAQLSSTEAQLTYTRSQWHLSHFKLTHLPVLHAEGVLLGHEQVGEVQAALAVQAAPGHRKLLLCVNIYLWLAGEDMVSALGVTGVWAALEPC